MELTALPTSRLTTSASPPRVTEKTTPPPMPPPGTARVDTFRPFDAQRCGELEFNPARENLFPIFEGVEPATYQSADPVLLPVLQESEYRVTHEAQAVQTAEERERALTLGQVGIKDLWLKYAAELAQTMGPQEGFLATALVTAVLDSAGNAAEVCKQANREPRPFQADPTVALVGHAPGGYSHPSGHAAMSYAAATALGELWPARAEEFLQTARNVALSRVELGVHFMGDVAAGARLGTRVAQSLLSTARAERDNPAPAGPVQWN